VTKRSPCATARRHDVRRTDVARQGTIDRSRTQDGGPPDDPGRTHNKQRVRQPLTPQRKCLMLRVTYRRQRGENEAYF
jgi:hypothetical protein